MPDTLAGVFAGGRFDGRELLLLSGADLRKVAIARAIWEKTVVPQSGWRNGSG